MCTLCSTPTRPFVGPSRLLAGRARPPAAPRSCEPWGCCLHHGAGPAGRGQRRARPRAPPRAVSSLEAAGFTGAGRPRGRGRADAGHRALAASRATARRGRSGRRRRRRKRPRRGEARVGRARQPPRPHRRDCRPRRTSCPARRSSPCRRLPARAPRRPRSPCSGTTAASGCSSTPISSRASCCIDPELLLGLPPSVTASGGFDAIGHAVESLLSTFRTPVTISAAREALSLLSWSLPAAYEQAATWRRATAPRSAPTRPGWR